MIDDPNERNENRDAATPEAVNSIPPLQPPPKRRQWALLCVLGAASLLGLAKHFVGSSSSHSESPSSMLQSVTLQMHQAEITNLFATLKLLKESGRWNRDWDGDMGIKAMGVNDINEISDIQVQKFVFDAMNLTAKGRSAVETCANVSGTNIGSCEAMLNEMSNSQSRNAKKVSPRN